MGDMKPLATKSVAEVFHCQPTLSPEYQYQELYPASDIFHCQSILRRRWNISLAALPCRRNIVLGRTTLSVEYFTVSPLYVTARIFHCQLYLVARLPYGELNPVNAIFY
jgi:hypothetical protein